MTIGSKQKYTAAQKRKAEHIEESYEAKGVSHEKAEQIAWATVNKHSGGGELSGSGITTSEAEKEVARQDSAQNAAETRKAKSESNSLEEQSISVLRSKARKRRISGRSMMNKVELILALRQAR